MCDWGGVTGTRYIIFGMFGVEVMFDGRTVINPRLPSFSPAISLIGLKLIGLVSVITEVMNTVLS